MTRPPDLYRLTESQKDALIVEQAARLRRPFEFIATLERRTEELEKQLGKPPKTPRNSSTPPPQGNMRWFQPDPALVVAENSSLIRIDSDERHSEP